MLEEPKKKLETASRLPRCTSSLRSECKFDRSISIVPCNQRVSLFLRFEAVQEFMLAGEKLRDVVERLVSKRCSEFFRLQSLSFGGRYTKDTR